MVSKFPIPLECSLSISMSTEIPGPQSDLNFEIGRTPLSGHSPVVDYGEEIRLPQFTAIPSPIQFESILDSGRKLALADTESNAYDKFLFGGDGVETDGQYIFPAEELIVQRMSLESSRAAALGKRDLLKGLVQRLTLQSKHREVLEDLNFLEAKERRLAQERELHGSHLDGERIDADGTKWLGLRRDPAGWIQTRWTLWSSTITLLFVASVDMLVLMMSLAKFIGNDLEGIAFSIPALGIQVFFPHLIGERLARVVRGKRPMAFDLWSAGFFGAIWLGFAYLIAIVRSLYLESEAQRVIGQAAGSTAEILRLEAAAKQPFALPITLIIMLGLGTWLIFSAFKTNPHELAYLRLGVQLEKIGKLIASARTEEVAASNRVALQDRAISMLEQNVTEHVDEIRTKFVDAGLKSYRRAIVNSVGNPDFTTAATKGFAEFEKK